MLESLLAARSSLEGVAHAFDAGALAATDALRAVDELGAMRRLVDGMLAKAAKRVADTGAHSSVGERTAATFVARAAGMGTREVRAAIATAAKLENLPVTDAAVRAGLLSRAQAQMIAEAASANPCAERELLDAAGRGFVPLRDACIAARARVESPEGRVARQRRLRNLRTWTDVEGMFTGGFAFTPEVGARMKAAIEAESRRLFRAHRSSAPHEPIEAYAADALASLVLRDGKRGSQPRVQAVVHVIIDHGALVRGGAVDGEVCEVPGVGPVDVSWARELLGSAFLTAVIKRGKDIRTVAHLGRHVPAELQTALLVSGRECDVEDCHHRGYLERDHVHAYAKGGPTSFANLCWLCYRHHRMKTDGWQLGPAEPDTRKRKLRPPPARAA